MHVVSLYLMLATLQMCQVKHSTVKAQLLTSIRSEYVSSFFLMHTDCFLTTRSCWRGWRWDTEGQETGRHCIRTGSKTNILTAYKKNKQTNNNCILKLKSNFYHLNHFKEKCMQEALRKVLWLTLSVAEGCKNNSLSSSFDTFSGSSIVDWAFASHCSPSIAAVNQHDRISESLIFSEALK